MPNEGDLPTIQPESEDQLPIDFAYSWKLTRILLSIMTDRWLDPLYIISSGDLIIT